MTKPVPVEIEITGTGLRKTIGWTAVGYTVGALLAGPIGGLIGVITQGNAQKVNITVKFDDGSQRLVTCNDDDLLLELIIWAWRINNKKSESDYIELGLDFNSLQRGSFISSDKLMDILGYDKNKASLGYGLQTIKLYAKLQKILKEEIQRYFREQRGESIMIQSVHGGFKIPDLYGSSLPPLTVKPIPQGQAFLIFIAMMGIGIMIYLMGYINTMRSPDNSSPPSVTR